MKLFLLALLNRLFPVVKPEALEDKHATYVYIEQDLCKRHESPVARVEIELGTWICPLCYKPPLTQPQPQQEPPLSTFGGAPVRVERPGQFSERATGKPFRPTRFERVPTTAEIEAIRWMR